MSKPQDTRQKDLLRPPLEEIIDLGHPLARLAREIDIQWDFLDGRFGSVCKAGPGQPPLPTRLVAGLLILKHMHDLSDEGLCARWLENPYYQYFCGEESFCHHLPFERSSLTRWRQRLGAEQLAALMAGRYAHAKQFKRHNRELKFLRTRLIRDIRRKIDGDEALEAAFATPLSRAAQVRHQRQRQRGPKLYALHAPEVECIGKGKARAPYEFGCKVSVATPVTKPKGGQFVLHAKALHGNPYDGHTLGPVVAEMEKLTGIEVRRIHVDKGYRGHSHAHKFRVWISGQTRRVTKTIRREMKRRAAVEPVIGHVKAEHRMDRNYLKGRHGDRANAVLAAAGYNFALLLRWFDALLHALINFLLRAAPDNQTA